MRNDTQIVQNRQRTSFHQLFAGENVFVQIPKIQRDYAQGRESAGEIRRAFLLKLSEYLEKGHPFNDLDFIYGTEKKEKGRTLFLPLDGQQRLTTLFLLHWYLASIAGETYHLRSWLQDAKGHSRFTYETRISSREFCDKLLGQAGKESIDFALLGEAANLTQPEQAKATYEEGPLAKMIKDTPWFHYSWESDPTIRAMLTMLDDIHHCFNGKLRFYHLLVDTDKPVVTFYRLNLPEYKLTDDLYIKMNARGVPLSAFETFKAQLEKFLAQRKISRWRVYKLGNIFRPLQQYVSTQMDADWTDLFWSYYKKEQEQLHQKTEGQWEDFFKNRGDEVKSCAIRYDDEFMNCIRVLLTGCFLGSGKPIKIVGGNPESVLIGVDSQEKNKHLSYQQFYDLGAITIRSVLTLAKVLDALSDKACPDICRLSEEYRPFFLEKEMLGNVFSNKLSLNERVLFHAYSSFLARAKGKYDGIDEWMRTLRNLSLNSMIDSPSIAKRAIKTIESLIPYRRDILSHLVKESPKELDGFLKEQVAEEVKKAAIIKESLAWGVAIRKAERNEYFRGQIGFLLEFSGIKAKKPSGADISQAALKRFQNYSQKMDFMFTSSVWDSAPEFLWERAVLSMGDYLSRTAHGHRRNFFSSHRIFRDHSWKRFLRDPAPWTGTEPEGEEKVEDKRYYVKKVLDNWCFSPEASRKKNIQALKELIENGKGGYGNWYDLFLEEPRLIAVCKQGYIQVPPDGGGPILLYNASQHNFLHAELFSYHLYLKHLIDQDWNLLGEFAPFSGVGYEQRRGDESSYATMWGWADAEENWYELQVHLEPPEAACGRSFSLRFLRHPGSRNYPKTISELLEAEGFEKGRVSTVHTTGALSEKKTMAVIKRLCRKLSEIDKKQQEY